MILTEEEVEIIIQALIDIDGQWGLEKEEKILLTKLQTGEKHHD